MRKSRIALASLALVLIVLATTGFSCSNWERTTFDSLSASKAVIDQAAKDYNAGVIPQTVAAHDAIAKAQEVQTAAVNAFWAYQEAKLAKSGDLAAKQQIVGEALARLPELVGAVQGLYKH